MNLKKFLLAGLCSAFFIGCMTPKKELRIYNNYRSEHREEFAGDCAEAFPTRTEYIEGEERVTRDTITLPGETIPCPPPDPVTGEPGKVKCPDRLIIHDTIRRTDTSFHDGAKTVQLQLKADRLENELATMATDRDKEHRRAVTRLWIIIGLGVIVGIGIYLKIKK